MEPVESRHRLRKWLSDYEWVTFRPGRPQVIDWEVMRLWN